jgi:multidrug efflux pump subunit AcrA (membrane-fusion protein)
MAITAKKAGGTTAGAITGFFLAGPVGALIGGGVGYLGGSAWDNSSKIKTTTALTLMAGKQSINVSKGGTVGILAPSGGTVVSLAPAQGSHVGHLSVANGQGVAAGDASGDINVLWKAPDGSAQATVVTLTVA